MPIYSLDYETTSACDISRGAYRYAADPSTKILLFAIAKDDESPIVWRYDNCEGVESKRAKILLKEAVESGSPIRAFNAQFELAICHYVLERQLGIPCPKVEQFRCTQAMSRRAAAPESLAESAIFFGLGDQKNPIGKALIGVFSDQNKLVDLLPPRPEGLAEAKWKKLKRPSASPILETPVPWDWSLMVAGQRMTVREAWEMFAGYCRQDVVVEQALAKKLHKFELTGDVLDSFLFDMRMNLRGVPVNVPALRNAQQVVETIQTKTGDKFTKLTGLSITQNARLVEWLAERGYKHDNLRAGTVDQVLENPSADLTPDALEALRLRSLASFAALKKIPTMIDSAGDDGRVRGTTQWHAARTGRAGGRIIQPQNFKKSTIGDSEFCYDLLRGGFEPVWFEEFWESPLEAIASSIRHFIQPAEGMVLDADYTGVEARITPWLAGDTAKLDRILSGIDPYKHIATLVFKVPYEAVTKEQRTISKPIELGCCIAEGELVLTRRGLIAIENVLLDDLVWDGLEWVQHEGLLPQGEREVVTYQGLSATEDHEVWVEGRAGKIAFGDAIREGHRLVVSGWDDGSPIQRLDVDGLADLQGTGASQGDGCLQVRTSHAELLGRSVGGDESALREMPGGEPQESLPDVVGGEILRGEGAMRESSESAVQQLRGAGDSVQVRVGGSSSSVDDGKPRLAEGEGDRPSEQQRSLRARQHEVGVEVRPDEEQPSHQDSRGLQVPRGAVASVAGHHREDAAEGTYAGGDPGTRREHRERQEKELASNRRTVRTYDLFNAGPRHRFTVSGRLVSNCFGVGGKGLMTALALPPYNVKRTRALCNEYVKTYRDNHPETVQAWRDIEDAARSAINHPGSKFTACDDKLTFVCGMVAGIPYLVMRLPSGRRLYYPHPKVKATFKKYEEDEMVEEHWKREKGGYWIDQVSFYGKLRESANWGRVGTWGSRLFENAVQAIGADLLNYGCTQAEKEGYEIFMIVHDQALAHDTKPLDGFIEALCRKQPWAENFPLEASGAIHPFYLKD